MRFIWMDSPTHYRCTTDKPVQINTREFGGWYRNTFVQDMGYVLPRDGRWMACIYGTVHQDCFGEFFDDLDQAKAYVEEQALIGITVNKLTR